MRASSPWRGANRAATAIAREQELHEPVAEAADTIEEHDGMFVRHRSIMTRRANDPAAAAQLIEMISIIAT